MTALTSKSTTYALLIVLAFASISLKSILAIAVGYADEWQMIKGKVQENLIRDGFVVASFFDNDVIATASQDCQFYIYNSRPEGGDEPMRALQLGQFGRLAFWYDGEVYKDRPVIKPLINRLTSRLRYAVTADRQYNPLFGIYITNSCSDDVVEKLPLQLDVAANK